MNIALFGRHPSPAEHIVFPEGIPDDKMDNYGWMNNQCAIWIRQMYDSKFEHTEIPSLIIQLYVEGFTPALISFLDMWRRWYFHETAPALWLMHYQPDGTYRTQVWNP